MFENLSEKLQRAFKTLRGQAVLNEENIQEAMREIRLALLEADVNFKVVKQLIDHIQERLSDSRSPPPFLLANRSSKLFAMN
jgi:signal recognition particle subunit SRP54